jgi:hypothetical protein
MACIGGETTVERYESEFDEETIVHFDRDNCRIHGATGDA